MPELTAALETIRPELMNVTRLFGLPESVWDEPVRYRMDTRKPPKNISSPLRTERIRLPGKRKFPPIRTCGYRRCTAGGPYAGSASRRCTTCAAKPPVSIRRGAA